MLLIFVALLSAPAQAAPIWSISCDYSFMGFPASSVALESLGDGEFGPAALVTMQGRAHLESFTPEKLAADELAHGWISKENPESVIEMVIYREPKEAGQSKLVNHKMPQGKEMWGSCRVLTPLGSI